MRRRCLILTLSSVGIEHSDVVFTIPLRAFTISSGVIVSTCISLSLGSRKACKPDYEFSLAVAADLAIVLPVCRKASNYFLVSLRYCLVCQQGSVE